jgi:DNA ligase (NAD+)
MNDKLIKLSKLPIDKFNLTLKKNKIEVLKVIKEYLDDKYYNTGNTSEFTDQQYDILKDIILKKDKNYKASVGSKIREDDNKIKLPYWLGSLDKIKPEDENKLENWKKKYNNDKYIIENKLDGVSCLYMYKNNKCSLYTRGDGNIGSDITHLLKYIKNIPSIKEDISIRGELIIKEKVFMDKYSCTIANPRNMISGLVNAKSLREGINDIDFIAYEIILDKDEQNIPSIQLKKLKELGFNIVDNMIVNKDDLNIENLTNILIDSKEKSKYEIDGIIIQPESKYIRNTIDNPKYAFAYKINIFSEAIVEGVEWNISKHKLLKPRVKIEEINLNGVNINYASGSNAKNIVEKCIGKGAIVKITRSGDVIPFIVSVIKPASKPDMPDIPYRWNENNVDIIVEDDENNVSDIKMISSFFSNIGIKSISDATVEKIYNSGYNSLIKILEAKAEDFQKIDGFQETLAKKIYNNIHNGLKNISLDLLIGSSNILGESIGKRKVKSLLDGYPDIFKDKLSKDEKIEKIINIEGFSNKTAEKIVNNIEKTKKFLKDIDKYVSYTNNETKTNKLENVSVLLSGFRNADLESEIIKNGGKILSSVSKNLKILIVKDKDSTSSKVEKAKSLNIEILFEDEFKERYL